MAVNIQLEWTPNPNTLKYVADAPLLPGGALNFTSSEQAAQSPLALRLFDITGVVAVMVGKTFVTVTKGEEGEWDELNDAVMAALDQHLNAGLPVFTGELPAAKAPGAAGGGDVSRQIEELLDAEIRPAVMQDGGDVTLDRFENGVVYLNMKGSCSGCPSSTYTLKMGIETRLRELIPEVNEVVAV